MIPALRLNERDPIPLKDLTPEIRDEILHLWTDGFDTAAIADGLAEDGVPVAEAVVLAVILADRDVRYRRT